MYVFAAILLLLLTGVELVACEMIAPQNCEAFGTQTNSDTDDGCICCCHHITVTPVFSLETSYAPVEVVEAAHPPKPRSFSRPLYHPPRP